MAYRERLDDDQQKEAEKQDRVYVHCDHNGRFKMWYLGKIRNPKTRDENRQKNEENIAEISVGALHAVQPTARILAGCLGSFNQRLSSTFQDYKSPSANW